MIWVFVFACWIAACSAGGADSDREQLASDLVGEWSSPGCFDDRPATGEDEWGPECFIYTFTSTGSFISTFFSDYTDESTSNWSLRQLDSNVGLLTFEGGGIHLIIIEGDRLLYDGGSNTFERTGDGGSADLTAVEPPAIAADVVGTWHRPDGLSRPLLSPDVVSFHADGRFEAIYDGTTCTGVWGVAPTAWNNADHGGNMRLYADQPCQQYDRDIEQWGLLNNLAVAIHSDQTFFDGVEHRDSPSTELNFSGDVRISGPIRAGEVTTLNLELDQPFQYGHTADTAVLSLTSYDAGVIVQSVEFDPIALTPGELSSFEVPVVFPEATTNAQVWLSYDVFLGGEPVDSWPQFTFMVEVLE